MIETPHLRLVPGDLEILNAAIAGNELLAEKLGAAVSNGWTEFGLAPIQYAMERIRETAAESNWWTYFPVYRNDNQLIGSCGYKGKPNEDGLVEIGYEIHAAYRNRGLATEIATALIEHAFKDDRVLAVIAHTLLHLNASTSVLRKCGFIKVAEVNDPEDGLVWKWELKKKTQEI